MVQFQALPPFAPRIEKYVDLPDRSTPVLAQDINRWQARLADLTQAVNTAGQIASAASSSGSAVAAPGARGTLLVSDGSSWATLPPGGNGKALVRDDTAELGYSWRSIAGAEWSDVYYSGPIQPSESFLNFDWAGSTAFGLEARSVVAQTRLAFVKHRGTGDVYLAPGSSGRIYDPHPWTDLPNKGWSVHAPNRATPVDGTICDLPPEVRPPEVRPVKHDVIPQVLGVDNAPVMAPPGMGAWYYTSTNSSGSTGATLHTAGGMYSSLRLHARNNSLVLSVGPANTTNRPKSGFIFKPSLMVALPVGVPLWTATPDYS